MIPSATVRIQLHPGFTLTHLLKYVPYYASLGISHLYLSPITCARKGSSHGYDVTDYRHVDPELGGYAALTALAHCVHDHGMGLILDIVPNHMAAHPDNPWWRDVLQHGLKSRFAHWFDIQWHPARPWLHGKVLLPILSDSYGAALRRGDIRLVFDSAWSSYAIDVHGVRLPLAAGSLGQNASATVHARLAAYDASTDAGRQALHALLQRQHYRLAWWHCAADQINWRRFFEISDLVGVSIERDEVFDAVHELPLRLFEAGVADGLRVDHVDGLAQPLDYCRKLSQALSKRMSRRPAGRRHGKPWLVVEKILAHDEQLDERWEVDGTTGYDFMAMAGAVLHAPDGETPLTRCWHNVVHDTRSVSAWRRDARTRMLDRHFAAERDALLDVIGQLAQTSLATRDTTHRSLGRALDQFLIEFPVYRVYRRSDEWSRQDDRYLENAYTQARQFLADQRDWGAVRALEGVVGWLKDVIASEVVLDADDGGASVAKRHALQASALRRFQQLTPPLAAKALEDTVFYRYGRLLSRNEVGSDPGIFSIAPEDFHQWVQDHARATPYAMLATATHDHKRGEDARARLAVISEQHRAWENLSTRCLALMGQWVDLDSAENAAQCYMLLQTIVGAWPLELCPDNDAGMAVFIERIQQWQLKALREAKHMTSWFYPDTTYEQTQQELPQLLLRSARHHDSHDLYDFVQYIAPAGAMNSLSSVVLRCMAPGVPDLYQGTELWDFSLVDPDNRRRVDMATRVAMLHEQHHDRSKPVAANLLSHWRDGAVKQAILTQCLWLRREQRDVFMQGSYQPLAVRGAAAHHVLAFMRGNANDRVVVVVSRLGSQALCHHGRSLDLPKIPRDFWQDTRIVLPPDCEPGNWRDVLSGHGHRIGGTLRLDSVLSCLPVAVLTAD